MGSQTHPRSVVPDVNTDKIQILAVCKREQKSGMGASYRSVHLKHKRGFLEGNVIQQNRTILNN